MIDHATSKPDVIIVGAGPAGCAAAAVLGEAGHSVLILERQPFPRYRVGESLIPWCWYPLDRLGLVETLDEAAFTIHKHSVQFVGTDGGATTPFYFNEHTDHDCARTWQVRRSDFDRMMVDNAISKGATVWDRANARELLRDGETVIGVRAETEDGASVDLHAPLVIDASGRDLFSVSRQDWRVPDPQLKKIAIWSYFKGAARDCGIDEGATTVAYLPDKGWFWYIPLPDDVVSVGVVAERDYLYRGERDPDAIFAREIAAQPWIAEHVASGEKLENCRVTGDYSYRSKHCACDGLLLIGDAFAFLDPVFSSGVFLALYTGVLGGEAAAAALAAGDRSAARFDGYGTRVCKAIEAMRRLIYAFYDPDFSFGAFLKVNPSLRRDLTDLLIGNLDRDYDALFTAASASVAIPDPLPHGAPLVNEAATGDTSD